MSLLASVAAYLNLKSNVTEKCQASKMTLDTSKGKRRGEHIVFGSEYAMFLDIFNVKTKVI